MINNLKLSKEFKVGLLALVSGGILYVGFNFLKGIDFLNPTHTYFAVYDHVGTLKISKPVQINGLTVGRVSDISVLQERGNKLLVSIDVNKTLNLTDKTVALLGDSGFLDGSTIKLEIANGKTLEAGDTLLSKTETSMMAMISEKADPMMRSFDTTLTRVNSLLAEYNGMSREIRQILNNTSALSANLNGMASDNRQSVKNITDNASKLTASLVETEKSIKPLMQKMNILADSLNALRLVSVAENANRSIEELRKTLTAINKGQGSAGKMIYNDSLYNNLNRTLVDLDKLFIDLKANPKRYVQFSVFGKKEKK